MALHWVLSLKLGRHHRYFKMGFRIFGHTVLVTFVDHLTKRRTQFLFNFEFDFGLYVHGFQLNQIWTRTQWVIYCAP